MTGGPKVLVIRFSSIGDIILTTPVYRCLKDQIGAEVHLVTKRSFAFAVAGNTYIDKVHTIESKVDEVQEALKAENFDFVVDLHHNLRSLGVKRMLGAKSSSVNKLNLEKWLLVSLKWDRMPSDPHIVMRYMDALKPLGVDYDGQGMDFFIPEDQHMSAREITELGLEAGGFTALAVGTSTPTRSMEEDQLIQLCNLLDGKVVLIGGPGEQDLAGRICSACENAVTLAGKISLQKSASLISLSKVLIAPDTSLMHIGAAIDHPMITVWGSTTERFGMTPFYKDDSTALCEIVQVDGLKCRPCSKIGHESCPKGHFKCIRDIDLGRVASIVNAL